MTPIGNNAPEVLIGTRQKPWQLAGGGLISNTGGSLTAITGWLHTVADTQDVLNGSGATPGRIVQKGITGANQIAFSFVVGDANNETATGRLWLFHEITNPRVPNVVEYKFRPALDITSIVAGSTQLNANTQACSDASSIALGISLFAADTITVGTDYTRPSELAGAGSLAEYGEGAECWKVIDIDPSGDTGFLFEGLLGTGNRLGLMWKVM